MIKHILIEAFSPPEALVWRMWCGTACFAFEDGRTDPPTDFYLESEAHEADCVAYLRAYDAMLKDYEIVWKIALEK